MTTVATSAAQAAAAPVPRALRRAQPRTVVLLFLGYASCYFAGVSALAALGAGYLWFLTMRPPAA